MSATGITIEENDPAGSAKSDQRGGSDRFCKMNNQFLCLTFSLNSIQPNSNFRNSYF